MRGRSLALAAVVAVALAAAAWWALERRSVAATGPEAADGAALPGLAARVDAIDRIAVVGAGDAVLVELVKRDGAWRMPSREDWPGNQRQIGDALHRLGRARRLEAKTADPAKHARLGVEDVASAGAKGAELRLDGGGPTLRLVVGNNHPSLGGSYVRVAGDAQAWLIDEDVAPARDPAAWLDRRLVDLPMARVERIRVAPADGPAFVLARVDDRFTADGKAPASLARPDLGNATAGFPDQLAFDDVAADDGAAATRTVAFESVDGLALTVAAWPGDRGTWARLSVALDEAKARAWLERAVATAAAPDADADTDTDSADDAEADRETETDAVTAGITPDDVDARLATLREEVAGLQARFAGHRFLLPPHKAEALMRPRADFVETAP